MSDFPHPVASILQQYEYNPASTTALKQAIISRDDAFFDTIAGRHRTALAKYLSWSDDDLRGPDGTPLKQAITLEEVNTRTLAILAPDGTVYQLGDRVRVETSESGYRWGRKEGRNRTYENYLDFLGNNTVSLSRHPTYDNTPRDSPSVRLRQPSNGNITLIARGDIEAYRERFAEGTGIAIPESVNGWTLTEVETDSHDLDSLPSDIVKRIVWSNGDGTRITAKWRGSYNCWRLSTPVKSVITDANEDEYLYEIDVPQQVVTTDAILTLATEVLNALEPTDFQAPYDLQADTDAEASDRTAGAVPMTIPRQIGDWKRTERRTYSITWRNQNEQSIWHGFYVKLDARGGVKVYNDIDEEIHDQRYVRKHFPNGKPHPANIEEYDHWRRREMFANEWVHAPAFMIQTSESNVAPATLAALNNHTPDGISLETFSHGLSTNAQQTMDRDNGSLLAYQ